jgi:hypothetical protein
MWKAERFSWWLTSLMHRFPDTGASASACRRPSSTTWCTRRRRSTALAENYVGLAALSVLAGQHVADRQQPTVRSLLHLLEYRKASGLAAVRAGQRALAEVVEDDFVVIAVEDGLQVVGGPGVRVASHDGMDRARGGRAHPAWVSSAFFIAAPPCAIIGST